MRTVAIVCRLLALLLSPVSEASAQYIFLDTNRDGKFSVADGLSTTDVTAIDVWVVTDANRDGSGPAAGNVSKVPLSIFSYEFVLHASGGTVEWVRYQNLQETMDFAFGEMRGEADFYRGFAGERPLAPGRYKLGTLEVRVASGSPSLSFVSHTPRWRGLQTSFGSMNPGKEGFNAIMFTEIPGNVASRSMIGDWSDADGIGVGSVQLADKQPTPTFGVSVSPNPMNPNAVLAISTTHAGFLRVRLFDVAGRLVRTLVDKSAIPAGSYKVRLGEGKQKMASGVYFYSVDASEGHLQGRVVVLK